GKHIKSFEALADMLVSSSFTRLRRKLAVNCSHLHGETEMPKPASLPIASLPKGGSKPESASRRYHRRLGYIC
ncbi:hypothetical protein AVEN_204795-1, partial [Araneus ventricosus]